MGQIKEVEAVKFVVGILAMGKDLLAEGRELIAQRLGEVELVSKVWPFTSTKYYAPEMGENLWRQFIGLAEPGDPGQLVQMKITCNRAELDDAAKRGRAARRALNLDPGYISPAKLVLASTKDFSHRVYLGQGVYGEVTLQYHKGQWCGFDWTYPDYADSAYHEFFMKVRWGLLEQLRE